MSIGVELLDHRIYVCPALLDNMFFKVILPLTLLSAYMRVLTAISTTSPTLGLVRPFNLSHSGPGIVVLM